MNDLEECQEIAGINKKIEMQLQVRIQQKQLLMEKQKKIGIAGAIVAFVLGLLI